MNNLLSGIRTIMLALLFLCATTLVVTDPHAIAQSGNVVGVPDNDPEMNQAMQNARDSLNQFWAAVEKPPAGAGNFALKVGFEKDGTVEHMWCNEPRREGERIFATLNNTPQQLTHLQAGQSIEINPGQISDWMYNRADGKIVGGKTIRAILKLLPEDQAAQYRAILADE